MCTMTAELKKDWFVLHALSCQEQKVKDGISRRIQQEEMEDYIFEVLIPTETVSEVKQGKKTSSSRKFFPGYVLIHMCLYDEDKNLVDKTWYFIQDTHGIIGFVGGEQPVPLRPDEVDVIMNQIEEKKEKVKPKVLFETGETVKINDGPFLNFNGVIEEVDPDRGKLKISVSIFGRVAPVELEYWQVERTF
ncbi:MAG: transcription termination/antitermination protein NusG [Kiritimatiellae bacterium]|nr:transcription termination/antitermination protein NusG [Kiritimatiellia bacterium]